MKKIISMVLIVIMISSFVTVFADSPIISGTDPVTGKSYHWFYDVGSTHWFFDSVMQGAVLGYINGYPDNYFRPQNNLTVAELVKILITAMGYTERDKLETSKVGHWALEFMDEARATDIQLILSNEYVGQYMWDKPVSRPEAALLLSRAMWLMGSEPKSNFWDYKVFVKDFDKINTKYNEAVCKAYSIGIIGGYPDGTFGYDKDVTRAEVSTLVMRLLYDKLKLTPKDPTEYNKITHYTYHDDDVWCRALEQNISGSLRYDDGGALYVPHAGQIISESDVKTENGLDKTNYLMNIVIYPSNDYITSIKTPDIISSDINKQQCLKALSYIYPTEAQKVLNAVIEGNGKARYSQTILTADGIPTKVMSMDGGIWLQTNLSEKKQ